MAIDESTVGCSFPNKASERVSKYSLRDAYRVVSWVYACINAIAEAISGVPLEFWDSQDLDTRQPLGEEHPIRKVFYPPKPYEIPTLEDFIKQIYINLGIFGEAFVPYEFKGSKPENVPIRNPYLFEAVLNDNTGDVEKWKMQIIGGQGATGKEKILRPDQLMHIKYYDPYNRHRGLSPLNAGRLPIEQEINMSVWNAGFFQGGIRNPVVILLKHMLGSGPARTQFLQNIKNQYMGFVKGHGPLVIEGGADARPLLSSIKDLDFIEGKSLTREEICALYGVPPAQVGIFRYANYANSREQTRLFWVNTLIPKMRILRNTLQSSLLDLYYPDVFVDWDWARIEAIREDPVSEATAQNLHAAAANVYYNMGYTKEEIATILDDIDLAQDSGEDMPEEEPEAPPEDGGEGEEEEPVEESILQIRTDADGTLIEASHRIYGIYTQLYQNKVLDIYTKQYVSFLKTFTKTVINEGIKGKEIDQAKWQKHWIESIRPLMKSIYYEGVRQAAVEHSNPARILGSFGVRGLKIDDLVAGEDPNRSIDFFSRATSSKSFVITGALLGYLRSPSANILSETPDAVILPLVSIAEAQWAVSRIYHHGKIVAGSVLGVEKHAWASWKCPIEGHDQMTGMVVTPWEEFNKELMHPNSGTKSAPVTACTCTVFPIKLGTDTNEGG